MGGRDDSEHHFGASDMDVEEPPFDQSVPDDDSDIPLSAVVDIVLGVDFGSAADMNGFVTKSDGDGIERNSVAESDHNESIVRVDEELTLADNAESIFELPERSHQDRIIKPNRWYDGNIWEHA
ncbi:hypothetical protein ARMSODRAFT_1022350 [Armillaria solidipes]|uniref:Uncharacterized protein n=1 Tax=Armillaria solidipes TaxID=1076256 RepID=A0A2H3BQ65_9AGAR|nr:hypothetical protein ARMSODRAFT_1022350 [Armillaria solidipes]